MDGWALDTSKTLVTGLRIVRFLEFSKEPVSAQELSRWLGLPRSTTYRFLKTLVQQGFVVQSSSGFMVGPYVNQASRGEAENALRTSGCRQHLAAIAEDIQETVVLTVIRWPYAFALDAVEGPRAVRWSFEAGTHHTLYAGASAKVLLAFLSDEALEDYSHVTSLTSPGRQTSLTWPILKEQIKDIRAQQFCVSYGEVDEGVAALAVPVFFHGAVIASISVVGPTFRFNPESYTPTLQKHVRDVEYECSRVK